MTISNTVICRPPIVKKSYFFDDKRNFSPAIVKKRLIFHFVSLPARRLELAL